MADIVTLTINPAIDASTSVEQLAPFHKMRCSPGAARPGRWRHQCGQGGEAIRRRRMRDLSRWAGRWASCCGVYWSKKEVTGFPVPISEETREDFTVLETVSGRPYRFVLPGPRLCDQEWRACLDTFAAHASQARPPRFVVASGSLPPGVPATSTPG